VLKLGFLDPFFRTLALSQTFPEGKGVETGHLSHQASSHNDSRRPSQKVKVLKLTHTLYIPPDLIPSQTFPEGKGVETMAHPIMQIRRYRCRRPSQKVKVLKLPIEITAHLEDIHVADLPRR